MTTLRRLLAVVAAGACVAACQTVEPPVVLVEPTPPPRPPVEVVRRSPPPAPAPARASCVPRNLPRAPRYPDTDNALRNAGGAADRYQMLAAGRLLRAKRLAELERIVEGCR